MLLQKYAPSWRLIIYKKQQINGLIAHLLAVFMIQQDIWPAGALRSPASWVMPKFEYLEQIYLLFLLQYQSLPQ